jgi:uncharacterized protein (TIGR00266 family)
VSYEIRYKPAFATLFIDLQPGEKLTAEAGAMASMDGKVTMATSFFGGLFPALMKAFLGGESLFVNTFSNTTREALQLVLTQASVGDIEVLDLKANEEMCLQPGAYIAHMGNLQLGVQWAGIKSWLSGEGLFRLKVKGPGRIFFGAYGGISEYQVRGDFVVDTGHLVAYSPALTMNIKMAGGLVGSITSGEGLVNRLEGNGKIYLQSRSIDGLAKFLRTKLR